MQQLVVDLRDAEATRGIVARVVEKFGSTGVAFFFFLSNSHILLGIALQ